MSNALELRGISKRFVVGAVGCFGSVEALRSVDLVVGEGEAITIAGGPGAGKSTLLLVAAGLLRAEGGHISWFGRADRALGVERATYYYVGASVKRSDPDSRSPHLHLVDGPESLCLSSASRIERWIDLRRDAGDAVVIATRSVDVARELAPRTLVLRAGRIHADEFASTSSRVAEGIGWPHG
jgi:ABC-type branched-subunit amino acid transport system ATPase component